MAHMQSEQIYKALSKAELADGRRTFDHIGQFNFHVELEGIQVASFKAVSGLQMECEPIEYMWGDEGVLRKRPGRVKPGNITLKRGYSNHNMKALWDWWMSVQRGKVERKSGSIVLCNDKGMEIARYNFTEAWPVKWKGWELDGQGNATVVEELEICCESLELAGPTGV